MPWPAPSTPVSLLGACGNRSCHRNHAARGSSLVREALLIALTPFHPPHSLWWARRVMLKLGYNLSLPLIFFLYFWRYKWQRKGQRMMQLHLLASTGYCSPPLRSLWSFNNKKQVTLPYSALSRLILLYSCYSIAQIMPPPLRRILSLDTWVNPNDEPVNGTSTAYSALCSESVPHEGWLHVEMILATNILLLLCCTVQKCPANRGTPPTSHTAIVPHHPATQHAHSLPDQLQTPKTASPSKAKGGKPSHRTP